MKKWDFSKFTLLISVCSVVIFVIYITQVSSSKYKHLLVEHAEEDAVRSGSYLAALLLTEENQGLSKERIVSKLHSEQQLLDSAIRHLGFEKLRIFSSTGEILYSSDRDEIGTISDKDYFFNLVTKGKIHTKTVVKDARTLDGVVSQKDVVETYIPVMKKGNFVGAFEIYYDISERKSKLAAFTRSEARLVVIFSGLLLLLITVVSLKASKSYQQLRQTETRLKKAYQYVEEQVFHRTAELEDTNKRLEQEVEERKRYEKQMLLDASVFENTIEGIVITDKDGVIQRVNVAFTAITGYKPEEVIGGNPRLLKSNRHDPQFYEEMWKALIERGTWQGEIWNRRKNGETYPEWLSINAIRNPEGETLHYVALFHDITDIKHSEEKLHYQAYHDALTDLPNRELFNDRLQMALSHAQRNRLPVGILFVDLDDFKNINDSLGHYYGDLLLQQVSVRLKRCCREEDTVARVSGDEFLLIAQYLNRAEPAAASLAERIINSFQDPFLLQDKQVHVSASIGLAIYPHNGQSIGTLVKNADMALYRSKGQGKNQFTLFTEEMNQVVLRKISLGNDLRRAMQRKEFVLYYQPKVDIGTGLISGAEALIRWNRLGRELVSPAEFIPVAEDTGVINPMGDWVLETACRQAVVCNSLSGREFFMAVNLSVKQFCQKNLVTTIESILDRTALAPHLLTIEITESIVIEDIEETISTLNRLKKLGIKVSIDDFGTGYSSLSYLKKMPLSELKIDKSFVDNTPGDGEACAIVETIISLAKSLKLKTVAEGVEKREQLAFLRDLGCDEIQGYLFSRPLPEQEFIGLVRENKRFQV